MSSVVCKATLFVVSFSSEVALGFVNPTQVIFRHFMTPVKLHKVFHGRFVVDAQNFSLSYLNQPNFKPLFSSFSSYKECVALVVVS